MRICLDISKRKIADIMTSAVEGNHMTRSWCSRLEAIKGRGISDAGSKDPWYHREDTYGPGLVIEVDEITDESKEDGAIKTHTITMADFRAGIAHMAKNEAQHFANWISEDGDIITADVFLQCVVLRKVVYG